MGLVRKAAFICRQLQRRLPQRRFVLITDPDERLRDRVGPHTSRAHAIGWLVDRGFRYQDFTWEHPERHLVARITRLPGQPHTRVAPDTWEPRAPLYL